MTRKTKGAAGRRTFIALALPEDVRAALAALQLTLPLPRPVPVENLHLTLLFLGAVADPLLEEVHHSFAALRAAPFDVELRGVGLFGGDRPRVAWAGVAPCPALTDLQARVERAARRAGAAFEARRFTPHVTLARFAPGRVDAARLEHAAVAMAGFRTGPFRVEEFDLCESHLSAAGAQYHALARYPLDG